MEINDLDVHHSRWAMLRTLFGSYLHQDFDAEYGGPWESVSAFASNTDATRKADTAREARMLATELHDEHAIAQAMDEFGFSYYPPADGYTYRGWLLELAAFLDPEPGQGAHPDP